ncbi:SufBD protein [candidate division KSB1 bacterium 4484_87]|nr:MAG: SufBD protein [candidate division KSB1 bacterium 4484_87]
MSDQMQQMKEVYETTESDSSVLNDPEVAHLVIHQNKVLGLHKVPGLEIDVTELDDGVELNIRLADGTIVKKPVHLCFGIIPETGVQRIKMDVKIGKNAKISLLSHCTFPNAVDIQHIMDAEIVVGENSEYNYFERHIHGTKGGIKVVPTAKVTLEKGAKFITEFELLKGRVGEIYIDYQITGKEDSVMEMTSRISGTGDDFIQIKESGFLVGERARGVLTSKIAAREKAQAEVYNTLRATAPFTRGHVDCHEIVKDEAIAKAIPIVDVQDPRAHVTHEAAIGSVDNKQLETLMSRGMDEDEAVELIINGLLS